MARGLALAAVLTLATLGAAQAASGATGQPTNLFVTSPSDPISIIPGSSVTTTITVGNPGSDPVDLRVSAARVELGDNGATHFVPGQVNPVFGDGVSIHPATLHLGARKEAAVTIAVRAPRRVVPNDYFLGFLVTPQIHTSSVAVVDRIGTLIVLDVPGSRDERLVASYVGLPGIALWGSADGSVLVKSVGRSIVRYTTDTEISGFPSSGRPAVAEPPQLLAPGLSRLEPIHVSSWLGLGWVTLRTTLVYNLTNQRTGQVTLTKTVLLVSPIWFVVPVVVLAGGVYLVLRRQRRSSGRRRGTGAIRPRASGRATLVGSRPGR